MEITIKTVVEVAVEKTEYSSRYLYTVKTGNEIIGYTDVAHGWTDTVRVSGIDTTRGRFFIVTVNGVQFYNVDEVIGVSEGTSFAWEE